MSNMFRDMGDLQESAYRLSKETQCDARTDRANEQKSVKCYSMDMEHHEHGSFSLNIASVFVPYAFNYFAFGLYVSYLTVCTVVVHTWCPAKPVDMSEYLY